MKNNIIAPIGAFGHQLRLLCLLDESYNQAKENMLNWITKEVYPTERTWYNWHTFEFKTDKGLEDYICWNHDIPKNINDREKYIFCVGNVDFFRTRSFKFNPRAHYDLDRDAPGGKEYWSKTIKTHIQLSLALEKKFKNIKTLDTTILWQKKLPVSIVDTLNEHFNLNLNYNLCNTVHEHWYDRQRNAESLFLKEVKELYE
jgi:hypothetical protein